MKSINSIFIGGKQIGVDCLRELVRAGMRPSLIIANSDDTGADTWHESLVRVAAEMKIPHTVGKKVKDPEVIKHIASIKPDIIFCIGGTELIPQTVLSVPTVGTINIHPALLPKYRGRFSIPHAIFNGEKEVGVTLHFMDEGMDTGPIILQKTFPLSDDDTAKIAYDNFTKVGTEAFIEFLDMLKKDSPIRSRSQDESHATNYPKGLPAGGEIDWSWDGGTIKRFIRAMTFEPFPPPSFKLGKKTMVIVDEKNFTPSSGDANKQ